MSAMASKPDEQVRLLLQDLIDSNDQSVQNVILLSTAFFGVIGYFLQNWLQARDNRRLWRLERIKAQLEEFYGPLRCSQYMAVTAFQNMLNRYADMRGEEPGAHHLYSELRKELRASSSNVDSPVVRLWMGFMRDFVLPSNVKMMNVLVTKGHLHDGRFPKPFLDFLGHVAEKQLMVQRWDQEDFVKFVESIPYPVAFNAIVRERIQQLKLIQAKLMGDDLVVIDDDDFDSFEEDRTLSQDSNSRESTVLFDKFNRQVGPARMTGIHFTISGTGNPRARGLSVAAGHYSELDTGDWED